MPFNLVSYIEETVPAWEECGGCGGANKCKVPEGTHCATNCGGCEHLVKDEYMSYGWACLIDHECPACSGQGGRWHEAVKYDENHKVFFIPFPDYQHITAIVDKSTLLRRRHEVCRTCRGKKKYLYHGYHPCPHCLKDSKGNPTGAEVGTATAWEVA